VSGLRLGYKGKSSYLSQSEKAEVIAWLNNKEIWDIAELVIHISRGDNKATKHSGAGRKHEAIVEN
jgi:transposase